MNLKKSICKYPFLHLEIDFDGYVYCCCPDYTNFYSFGNIFEQSFKEIWFGEKWQKFREDIVAHGYSNCNTSLCAGLDDTQFFKGDKLPELTYPQHITLSVDSTCNCQCVMCRDWALVLKKFERKRLKRAVSEFLEMVKHAEFVTLDGAGEVFASSFYKKFIRRAVEANPKLKFYILTNGILCNEKNIKDFGLEGRIYDVTISLHAACKRTYNRIVRKGNWEEVIKNIEYLSQLRDKNQIKSLNFTFVLSSLNYRDLPKFIEFAKGYNANVNIWPVRANNSCEFCENIAYYDISDVKHPKHKLLKKVLENSIVRESHLLINEQLGIEME